MRHTLKGEGELFEVDTLEGGGGVTASALTASWPAVVACRLALRAAIACRSASLFAAVQRVHLPGMMTSMFWGPGPLVCALVPVEMLQPCAAPALRVGAMLALISTARKRRAGVDWAAQVVGLYILVQYWLENDGLMKGAPVPAELSALLAAVLGTMGMHQKVESEVTQCHAGSGMEGAQGWDWRVYSVASYVCPLLCSVTAHGFIWVSLENIKTTSQGEVELQA